MKPSTLILSLLFLISCGTKSPKTEEMVITDKNIVKAFLADVNSLEKVEGDHPIVRFTEEAKKESKLIIPVDKEHIAEVIETAEKYKHCVIVADDHTLVKLINLENKRASGSWGVEMPYAIGYIQKGGLNLKEDYLNNLIGIPDNQDRLAFYFN